MQRIEKANEKKQAFQSLRADDAYHDVTWLATVHVALYFSQSVTIP